MKKKIATTVVLFAVALIAFAGNFDLKGVFLIVDESGFPLDGVDVSCQFNNESWRSYGTSGKKAMELGPGYIKEGEEVNFVQYQPCFPRGGSTVSWRFRKAGYNEVIISESMPSYGNGTGRDAEIFQKVKMTQIHGRSSSSHLDKPSSDASGFYCLDCETELVRLNQAEYYCLYCRKGRCKKCHSFYHPKYHEVQGHQVMKDSYGVHCKCPDR